MINWLDILFLFLVPIIIFWIITSLHNENKPERNKLYDSVWEKVILIYFFWFWLYMFRDYLDNVFEYILIWIYFIFSILKLFITFIFSIKGLLIVIAILLLLIFLRLKKK